MRAAAAAERLVRCCRIDLIALSILFLLPFPLPSTLAVDLKVQPSLFESDGEVQEDSCMEDLFCKDYINNQVSLRIEMFQKFNLSF